MNHEVLRDIGVQRPMLEQVVALAKMTQAAGMDGVVASAQEAPEIRRACGDTFLIVTPGIRGASAKAKPDDQTRTTGPAEAVRAGANYIVVGRPIIAASDPRGAAEAIVNELNRG
jgi:orotidine-5'-phosphate decarboxylase